MRSKEFVSTLSASLLHNILRNQRQPRRRSRYEPTVVYYLAEQAKADGVDLGQAEGPWRVGSRALPRPGRNSLDTIPVVTNQRTEVMVDTMEHASDVAGLLNWCGIDELDLVADGR
jgi:hypothetical protein